MRFPRRVLEAYLRRGAGIWLLMRLSVSAVLLFGREDPLDLTGATTLTLILGSAALLRVDIRRRHERLLIGNLGLSPWVVSSVALIPAALGEIAIGMLAGVWT